MTANPYMIPPTNAIGGDTRPLEARIDPMKNMISELEFLVGSKKDKAGLAMNKES